MVITEKVKFDVFENTYLYWIEPLIENKYRYRLLLNPDLRIYSSLVDPNFKNLKASM